MTLNTSTRTEGPLRWATRWHERCQLMLAASNELHRRNGRYALCTMCIGVGQGIAMILERV